MTEPSEDGAAVGGAGTGPMPNTERGAIGWKGTLLVCLLIVSAGAGAIVVIFNTEPTPQRAAATRETAMLVDVVEAQSGTFRPTVVATGTVRPAREIVLRPRIRGEVVSRGEGFVPGGEVTAGETLLQLDDADYRNTLEQRRNELDQAKADLRLQQARQKLARQEIRLLDETLTADNRALALREPQIDSARASVEIARTAVEQANLQLQRTSIEAPFDARVVSREVNLGSQVAAGDALARLVGTGRYWVETTVPVSKLPWLTFPGEADGEGAPVRIRNRGAWPPGVYREGHLFKRVGTLDEGTRMARVLVAVEDPLARGSGGPERPALMIGAYVQVRIEARPIRDVVRLEREYVRRDDTVWVMGDDGKLAIRSVEIVFRDSEYAYIRSGVAAGERVVTSSLATIREGAPLRLDGNGPGGETDAPAERGGDGPGSS